MKITRRFITLLAFFFIASLVFVPQRTLAQENLTRRPDQWTVYTIDPVPWVWLTEKPDAVRRDGIQFTLPDSADGKYPVFLLANYHGNLTGKMVAATLSLTAAPETVIIYRPEPNNDGPSPANVRLYFQTFSGWTSPSPVCSDYWYSNPVSVTLENLAAGGTTTLTNAFDPALWSDMNGHFGTNDAAHMAAFAAGLKEVKEIGLSFGGGWFFSTGVAVSSGSATFGLENYRISRVVTSPQAEP